MSTNTGPAFYVNPKYSIFEIEDFIKESLAVNFEDKVKDLTRLIVEAYYADFEVFNFKEFTETVKTPEDVGKYLNNREPKFSFHKNMETGVLSVRLMNFSRKAVKVFEETDFVSGDATYYNGSDSQLDEMSEEEWYSRRDYWDLASKYKGLIHNVTPLVTNSIVYFGGGVYSQMKNFWEEPENFYVRNWRSIIVNELVSNHTKYYDEPEDMSRIFAQLNKKQRFINNGDVNLLDLSKKTFKDVAAFADNMFEKKTIPFKD